VAERGTPIALPPSTHSEEIDMGKAYPADELVKRVFWIVTVGVGIEIVVMCLIWM
jgi:hypothetical protein